MEDYKLAQNVGRPNPTFVKRKARATKRVVIPSDRPEYCQTVLPDKSHCDGIPLWDRSEGVWVCPKCKGTIQSACTVRATLAALDMVASHRVKDIEAELVERYVVAPGEDPVLIVQAEDGTNIADVSLNLCANAAFVAGMVQSIDGGNPYTPMEYLVMAHTMETMWAWFCRECAEFNAEANAPNPTRRVMEKTDTSPSSESEPTSA